MPKIDIAKIAAQQIASYPKEFASVQVHPELGTVFWPCGADLDPDVLYALVSGLPIPHYDSTP